MLDWYNAEDGIKTGVSFEVQATDRENAQKPYECGVKNTN
jgi:hypothetical protein